MKPLCSLVTLLLLGSCTTTPSQTDDGDWIDLFNGKDLDNWIVKVHHHDVGDNFGSTFRATDSMISVRYDQYGEFNDQFAHLFYNEPLSHFHLKLQYRFHGELQRGAPVYTILNSGVMFHSQDPRSILKEQNWPISVEMQFLADLGDGKPRPTGNMCSPGTEIDYNGEHYTDHCLNSSSPTIGRDEWVNADLIVHGDSLIVHMINGDTVLVYNHPTMGGGVVRGLDSALWKPGAPLQSGYIGLQSEGQPIDFRNIKLRKLR